MPGMEGAGLTVGSSAIRVDFIEMTLQQIPREGEGLIYGSDYERGKETRPIRCVDNEEITLVKTV